MKEQLPAFLLYARDFITDPKVMGMTDQAVGVYIKLLCIEWVEQGLPNNPDELRRMMRYSQEEWSAVWAQLKQCFTVASANGQLLFNPRLEKERQRQIEARDKRVRAGRKGGKAGKAKPKQRSSNTPQSKGKVFTPPNLPKTAPKNDPPVAFPKVGGSAPAVQWGKFVEALEAGVFHPAGVTDLTLEDFLDPVGLRVVKELGGGTRFSNITTRELERLRGPWMSLYRELAVKAKEEEAS